MNEYTASTKFIDLSAQQKLIRPKIDLAIKKVLDHGQYIMGPEVSQFENNLKEFTTRGLDSDQTVAAIKATEKMLNIIQN